MPYNPSIFFLRLILYPPSYFQFSPSAPTFVKIKKKNKKNTDLPTIYKIRVNLSLMS